MKFTPLLLAATLALATSAHAQSAGSTTTTPNTAPENVQSPTQLDGEKGRQAARKATDATKRAFNRMRGKTEEARRDVRDDRKDTRDHAGKAKRDDTRAMGAAGSRAAAVQSSDGDRRARMDDAYANYRAQQQKR